MMLWRAIAVGIVVVVMIANGSVGHQTTMAAQGKAARSSSSTTSSPNDDSSRNDGSAERSVGRERLLGMTGQWMVLGAGMDGMEVRGQDGRWGTDGTAGGIVRLFGNGFHGTAMMRMMVKLVMGLMVGKTTTTPTVGIVEGRG
jgi:hypothetical protein